MKNIILQQITPDDLVNLLVERLKSEIQKEFPIKESQEYLTRQETARLLQVSLVTLNDWSKRGILQSYRIGGRIRYKKSEIDQSFHQVKNLKFRRA